MSNAGEEGWSLDPLYTRDYEPSFYVASSDESSPMNATTTRPESPEFLPPSDRSESPEMCVSPPRDSVSDNIAGRVRQLAEEGRSVAMSQTNKKRKTRKSASGTVLDDQPAGTSRVDNLEPTTREGFPAPDAKYDGVNWQTLDKFESLPSFRAWPPLDKAKRRRLYRLGIFRPGPEKVNGVDQFHVDSIAHRINYTEDGRERVRYVVRWTGWEDEFNTVETTHKLKHLYLFRLFLKSGKKVGICGVATRSTARRSLSSSALDSEEEEEDNALDCTFIRDSTNVQLNKCHNVLYALLRSENALTAFEGDDFLEIHSREMTLFTKVMKFLEGFALPGFKVSTKVIGSSLGAHHTSFLKRYPAFGSNYIRNPAQLRSALSHIPKGVNTMAFVVHADKDFESLSKDEDFWSIHASLFVVQKEPRKYLYWDPMPESLVGSYPGKVIAETKLSGPKLVDLAFGDQFNTIDCLKRVYAKMAEVVCGVDVVGQYDWITYDCKLKCVKHN